jgi:hypothetical protein
MNLHSSAVNPGGFGRWGDRLAERQRWIVAQAMSGTGC